MAPHLVRAQSAYKDILYGYAHFITHTQSKTHKCTHTHTTLQIHALLVMGWYNEKKMTVCRREEKRWVFSFELKDDVCESVMHKLGRWGKIRITIL